ncbi:Peptidyl-Lys metalloendopeptidase [Leucoagaricus sp. SymC.cos]|nr:Peptidyl-Lys metalloendopeptidase [Leucoagaricus sp. SymC.cos]
MRNLICRIQGPELVDNVENLKVTTTITNTGDEMLKLLNDPLSPLSQLLADTFKITGGAKNATPSFQGIKAKFVPEVTSAYCMDLEPGKSINIEHDLSKAYDFTQASEGTYSFEARNLFYTVGDSAKVTTVELNCFQQVMGPDRQLELVIAMSTFSLLSGVPILVGEKNWVKWSESMENILSMTTLPGLIYTAWDIADGIVAIPQLIVDMPAVQAQAAMATIPAVPAQAATFTAASVEA